MLDEVGAQGLVLALLGRRRFEEEALRLAYIKWLSVRHIYTLLHWKFMSSGEVYKSNAATRQRPTHIGKTLNAIVPRARRAKDRWKNNKPYN